MCRPIGHPEPPAPGYDVRSIGPQGPSPVKGQNVVGSLGAIGSHFKRCLFDNKRPGLHHVIQEVHRTPRAIGSKMSFNTVGPKSRGLHHVIRGLSGSKSRRRHHGMAEIHRTPTATGLHDMIAEVHRPYFVYPKTPILISFQNKSIGLGTIGLHIAL